MDDVYIQKRNKRSLNSAIELARDFLEVIPLVFLAITAMIKIHQV